MTEDRNVYWTLTSVKRTFLLSAGKNACCTQVKRTFLHSAGKLVRLVFQQAGMPVVLIKVLVKIVISDF